MIRVVLESPFGKRVDGTSCTIDEMIDNIAYARACMADCFARGEAPYASHLLYPQIFDDAKPEERAMGMAAGAAWSKAGMVCAVYCDRGITPGMQDGIHRAIGSGQVIDYRWLEPEKKP